MSKIKAGTTTTTAYQVEADTTGALVLQTGATPTTAVTISSSQVATFAQAPVLPAASIPQAALASNVAGNGPAFFAYQASAQTISSATLTKVTLDTELFDTNSNFLSNRFTPTVAGYYQISATIAVGALTTSGGAYIYKNGAIYGSSYQGSMNSSSVSTLIYLNGSTDYVELYVYFGTGQVMATTNQQTFMSGAMVRAA